MPRECWVAGCGAQLLPSTRRCPSTARSRPSARKFSRKRAAIVSSSEEGRPAAADLLLVLLVVLLCSILSSSIFAAHENNIQEPWPAGAFPKGANEIKGPARCSHLQLYLFGAATLGRPGHWRCSPAAVPFPAARQDQRRNNGLLWWRAWLAHHTLALLALLALLGPPSNLTQR